jgi:DNA recombination protein RmuC
MNDLIFLGVGLLLGALVAWLWRRAQGGVQQHILENQYQLLQNTQTQTLQELQESRQRILALTAELAAAEANFNNLEDKVFQQKEEFKSLASEVIEARSQQQYAQLQNILLPFQEKLQAFGQKVETTHLEEVREKTSLLHEVRRLHELNTRLSDEAQQLTRALRGDVKQQGNWGELILEKVLERSGLVKEVEYKVQVSDFNAQGQIIRPDVVVFLPENKHLIIDAKVSLTAYEQWSHTEDPALRERLQLAHLTSVKNHIRLLSDKNYPSADRLVSPEMVLLFMPIEAAFGLALQADSEVFQWAWERRIVLVSPTTLLATLRTVASVWKFEKQSKNVLEIARLSGEMYDKFEGFVQDMLRVSKQLRDAQEAQATAMSKLMEGRGNLIRTAEKIKELGARSTKNLPQKLIDQANEA